MRIELTKADDAASLHSGRPELWIRVLSSEPLGPDDFRTKVYGEVKADLDGYSTTPIKFYADLAGAWEDEPEDSPYTHEQWWIFQKVGIR